MPGTVCGRYTRTNARSGRAPSEAAARMYSRGMPRITLYSGSTMNGSRMWVMAT